MKQLKYVLILGLAFSVCAFGSDRQTRYFELEEASGTADRPTSFVMTMTSSDLKRYPRAVVTFEVREKAGRAPSSISPAATGAPGSEVAPPASAHVRRHYTKIEDDQFGRLGEPQVVFDRKEHTVYLGFIGKEGRLFKFKEVERPGALPATVERLGKADAQ